MEAQDEQSTKGLSAAELVDWFDRVLFNQNDPIVVALKGGWGEGKTYFWKKSIVAQRPTAKFLYASVFGAQSVQEVRERLVSDLVAQMSPRSAANDGSGPTELSVADRIRRLFTAIGGQLPSLGERIGLPGGLARSVIAPRTGLAGRAVRCSGAGRGSQVNMANKKNRTSAASAMFPSTELERVRAIATETSRMSYPSSMSRGKNGVVKKGTKAIVEKYFARSSYVKRAISGSLAATQYDDWHRKISFALAYRIRSKVGRNRSAIAVATKFVDTFMYQLMKYEAARPLLPALHLPLDRVVFAHLKRVASAELKCVEDTLASSPYELTYLQHMKVQRALSCWQDALNDRKGASFRLKSLIELNWIWALSGR